LGEEARENGLKYSLLERLQDIYEKCGDNALKHMVSLNTNYRCHEEIVTIPNKLFYESMIKICPQNAITHPETEYPLVFVCSSLMPGVDRNLEAEVILSEARKFVTNWPENWAEQDLSKIALVTASQTQVCCVLYSCNRRLMLFSLCMIYSLLLPDILLGPNLKI
jgi:ATP-dependent exoDNAse (exonuclease V) beta subunit